MKINNQKGIASIETALLFIIVAIIGFAGYKVYQNRQDQTQTSASQTSPASSTVLNNEGTLNPDSVPAINTSSDLNKAEQSLSNVNTSDDNSDLSQLDIQSTGF